MFHTTACVASWPSGLPCARRCTSRAFQTSAVAVSPDQPTQVQHAIHSASATPSECSTCGGVANEQLWSQSSHVSACQHAALLQEGFKPATFTSSRKNRAGQQQQDVSDFLDEDELEDLQKKGLQTRSEYDTFASAQGSAAHTEAAQEAASRHGHASLNLFPQEALRPVVNSIGIQLLQKMGWRQVLNLPGLICICTLRPPQGMSPHAVHPRSQGAMQRLGYKCGAKNHPLHATVHGITGSRCTAANPITVYVA